MLLYDCFFFYIFLRVCVFMFDLSCFSVFINFSMFDFLYFSVFVSPCLFWSVFLRVCSCMSFLWPYLFLHEQSWTQQTQKTCKWDKNNFMKQEMWFTHFDIISSCALYVSVMKWTLNLSCWSYSFSFINFLVPPCLLLHVFPRLFFMFFCLLLFIFLLEQI